MPNSNTTEVDTNVLLCDGEAIILGGLIKEQVTINDRGIPFLKDIPVLGYFFGAKERARTKTELLIVITPRVIGTPLEAARVTEELRRANSEADAAMRLSPRPPSRTVPPRPVAPTP